MKVSFSPAQIEQLKRDAKRLARLHALSLSQAQNAVAVKHGFQNWSLLKKHELTSSGAAAPPPHVNLAGSTKLTAPRQYLHGDEEERSASSYYCAECDVFGGPDHFLTEHRTVHGERFVDALSRWMRADAEVRHRQYRPDNAKNLFSEDAVKVMESRRRAELARSAFHRWLESQKGRNDPIGDLADDVIADMKFPSTSSSLPTMRRHIEGRLGSQHAVKALKEAWKEFGATKV